MKTVPLVHRMLHVDRSSDDFALPLRDCTITSLQAVQTSENAPAHSLADLVVAIMHHQPQCCRPRLVVRVSTSFVSGGLILSSAWFEALFTV